MMLPPKATSGSLSIEDRLDPKNVWDVELGLQGQLPSFNGSWTCVVTPEREVDSLEPL